MTPPTYDVIVSRAYATLAAFVQSTRHLLAPDGEWLAMKGKSPTQEIAEASRLGVAFAARPLVVPGLSADRCLLTAKDLPESERSPSNNSPSFS